MSEELKGIPAEEIERPKEPVLTVEELTPLQKEGLKLAERVEETEQAFQAGYAILSGLDQEENRRILSDALNQCVETKIELPDLEGAYLLPLKREDLREEFGVSFFPQTIVVPKEKWLPWDFRSQKTGEMVKQAGLSDKLSRRLPFEDPPGGLFIRGTDKMGYPFNITGIAFYNREFIDKHRINAHEELHRSFYVYSPFRARILAGISDISELPPRLGHERMIINEINAYREGVKSGEESWSSVKEILFAQFPLFIFQRYISERKITQACQTVGYLQKHLPETVITHILLHSRGLDDLISWSKVKPEEFQVLLEKREEK